MQIVAEGVRGVIDKIAGSPETTRPKITWQKAGRVTEPGRYMFTFGWLTVTADDIAVWRRYPEARFTMLRIPKPSTPKSSDEAPEDALGDADEYHLGTFELSTASDENRT
jgi:hypothetical protein